MRTVGILDLTDRGVIRKETAEDDPKTRDLGA